MMNDRVIYNSLRIFLFLHKGLMIYRSAQADTKSLLVTIWIVARGIAIYYSKSMHRKILKALHPDLHPNLSEAKSGLFFRAIASYRDGNLETMQAIVELITRDDTLTEEKSLHYALLYKRKRTAYQITREDTRKTSEDTKNLPLYF
ncbi:MAG: hypothetical protein LUE21_00130 [Oscillospiraceae bacterium]|nr:hypothetical protein [Oscillospiraceae bacterium]